MKLSKHQQNFIADEVTQDQLANVLRIARGNDSNTNNRITKTFNNITESGTLNNTTLTGEIEVSDLTVNALLYPNASGILSAAVGLSLIDNNFVIGTSTAYENLTADGPIYIGSEVPTTTTNRLYNSSGSLYWAGNLVAGAAWVLGLLTALTSTVQVEMWGLAPRRVPGLHFGECN